MSNSRRSPLFGKKHRKVYKWGPVFGKTVPNGCLPSIQYKSWCSVQWWYSFLEIYFLILYRYSKSLTIYPFDISVTNRGTVKKKKSLQMNITNEQNKKMARKMFVGSLKTCDSHMPQFCPIFFNLRLSVW